jgi:ABC-type multidrug transport system fused ATPase/permease subunit
MKLPVFDLSKPPHQKSVDLVLPLFPGAFFEISLLLGRPDIQRVLGERASHLGYAIQIALALFAAYFFGLVSVLWASILQFHTKSATYEVCRYNFDLPRRLSMKLNRLPKASTWFNRNLVIPLANRCTKKYLERERQHNLAYNVWVIAARKQLKHRYGIEGPTGPTASDHWSTWFGILGRPTDEQVRGSSVVRSIYASGWLGIVALIYAHDLRRSYYIGLTVLLIFMGTANDLKIASFWANPIRTSLNKTAVILEDLSSCDNRRNPIDAAAEDSD